MTKKNPDFLTPEQLVERWQGVTSKQRLQRWRIIDKNTGFGHGPLPFKTGTAQSAPTLYNMEMILAYEQKKYTHFNCEGHLFKDGKEVIL